MYRREARTNTAPPTKRSKPSADVVSGTAIQVSMGNANYVEADDPAVLRKSYDA
jgi:hypothetical protein